MTTIAWDGRIMAVGGSAADAVSAAMEHDSNTGGSIQVMEPGK